MQTWSSVGMRMAACALEANMGEPKLRGDRSLYEGMLGKPMMMQMIQ